MARFGDVKIKALASMLADRKSNRTRRRDSFLSRSEERKFPLDFSTTCKLVPMLTRPERAIRKKAKILGLPPLRQERIFEPPRAIATIPRRIFSGIKFSQG